MKLCLKFLIVFSTVASAAADDWPQWRGPQRNGVSKEIGLLKEWPKGGPRLIWKVNDVGSGYSTPSIVGDRVYLLGNDGTENEFVAALEVGSGKRVWTTRLGNVGNPNQKPPFPGSRSTPTVDGNFLYCLGSDGDLASLDRTSGKIRWQKNLRTDFGGKPGEWAYSESPLIDGDVLVCTPGGAASTMIALNKNSGEVVWKSPLPEGDQAAFASAVVLQVDGVKQYVQLLQKGLVGVEAKTGKLLWRYARAVSVYGANIPTPLVSNEYVYFGSAGTGGGLVKVKTAEGKMVAEEVYFQAKLPSAIGGTVKVGNHLYGTTPQALLCVDFLTGKVLWEERSIGASSLCFADERLYLHGENGQVALVEPNPLSYMEKSRFTPSDSPKHENQMEKSWAYPVVADGRLYIRDLSSLWCYAVR